MHYVVFVNGDEAIAGEMLAGPVEPGDEAYLRARVIPVMRPLSDEEYLNGPAAIVSTGARSSYVLDEQDVYWCVEWEPGLLVIRFTPEDTMSWAAVRSPNPGFGGREATEEEWDAYDEDAENPQYNLVFDAWDAQFDEEEREDWQPGTEEMSAAHESALRHVNSLHQTLEHLSGDEAASRQWMEHCRRSPIWKGEVWAA
jgi:hypothetical protein